MPYALHVACIVYPLHRTRRPLLHAANTLVVILSYNLLLGIFLTTAYDVYIRHLYPTAYDVYIRHALSLSYCL